MKNVTLGPACACVAPPKRQFGGIPAVNADLMIQAALKAGAEANQIVYWSRPLNWKNQTLTPNPDAIYFMPFWNTKDVGPVVVEIPPAEGGSITGSLMDPWLSILAPCIDQGHGCMALK